MDLVKEAMLLQVRFWGGYASFLEDALRANQRAVEKMYEPFVPSPEVFLQTARQMFALQASMQAKAENKPEDTFALSRG